MMGSTIVAETIAREGFPPSCSMPSARLWDTHAREIWRRASRGAPFVRVPLGDFGMVTGADSAPRARRADDQRRTTRGVAVPNIRRSAALLRSPAP
jgi:hypothetical protein